METETKENIWKLISEEKDIELKQGRANDRQEGEITFIEYTEITGFGKSKARNILQRLIEDGKVTCRRGVVNSSSGHYYSFVD